MEPSLNHNAKESKEGGASPKMIIGFAGSDGVGKDTAAAAVIAHFLPHTIAGKIKIMTYAFATPIKLFCHDFLGLTHTQLYNQKEKEVPLAEYDNLTPRDLMRSVGAVMRAMNREKNLSRVMGKYKYPIWKFLHWLQCECPADIQIILVTDVRFVEECDVIHQIGGKVIEIIRPNITPSAAAIANGESAGLMPDLFVLNHKTQAEFESSIISAVTRELSDYLASIAESSGSMPMNQAPKPPQT